MFRLIGIDPGARQTGLVLRVADLLITHQVIDGDYDAPVATPSASYLALILDSIDRLAVRPTAHPNAPILLCVEQVNAPTGFSHGRKHIIDPAPAIGAAAVYGAVIGNAMGHHGYDAARRLWVSVPPGRHGEAPIAWWRAEHPELVGPREGPSGGGKLRHCRAAWDIAGAGLNLVRTGK